MSYKTFLMTAFVAFGMATGAFTATSTADTKAADRRGAADALAAFSDAIRGVTYEYKQARMLAGTASLRATNGFTNGDRYLTNAYYTALYGRDQDLKNARDWLNSYLIVGTRKFRLSATDVQKVYAAIYHLEDFDRGNYAPSKLTEALNAVRDTQAFGYGHVNLSDAVNKIGTGLERRVRGYWFVPFTARWEARRAANALRASLKL